MGPKSNHYRRRGAICCGSAARLAMANQLSPTSSESERHIRTPLATSLAWSVQGQSPINCAHIAAPRALDTIGLLTDRGGGGLPDTDAVVVPTTPPRHAATLPGATDKRLAVAWRRAAPTTTWCGPPLPRPSCSDDLRQRTTLPELAIPHDPTAHPCVPKSNRCSIGPSLIGTCPRPHFQAAPRLIAHPHACPPHLPDTGPRAAGPPREPASCAAMSIPFWGCRTPHITMTPQRHPQPTNRACACAHHWGGGGSTASANAIRAGAARGRTSR